MPGDGAGRAKPLSLLLILLLLAAAAVQTAAFVLGRITWTSDQAVVGLMARHLVHSQENPIFYYGSAYAGTLEPRFIAGVFRLLGSSVATYRFALMALLALILCLVYAIARRALGQPAALAAVGYLALPPYFFLYKGLTSDGHYVSLAVLTGVVLLSAFAMDQAIDRRTSPARWIALLGLAAGLGWWVNPLISAASVAVAVWFLLLRPAVFRRPSHYVMFCLFFALGSLPWWFANVGKGWPSLRATSLIWLGPREAVAQIGRFWTQGARVLFGARPFLRGQDVFPGALAIAVLIFSVPVALAVARLFRTGPKESNRFRSPDRRLLLLALLALVSMVVLASLNPQSYDPEPRFLFPMYVPFALLAGHAFLRFRERLPRALWISAVAGVCLFHALGILRAPREDDFIAQPATGQIKPLVRWLEGLGLHRLYAGYWTGYRIAFESNERIICAPFGWGSDRSSRYPRYDQVVDAAPNPGVLLRIPEADAFEERLRLHRSPYRRQVFGPYRVFWDFSPEMLAEVRGERGVPGYVP